MGLLRCAKFMHVLQQSGENPHALTKDQHFQMVIASILKTEVMAIPVLNLALFHSILKIFLLLFITKMEKERKRSPSDAILIISNHIIDADIQAWYF